MTKEQKTRICHISTVHPPSDVRIRVRECRSLVEAGYEVHLVIQAPQDEVKDGIHIHALHKSSNRLVRALISPWGALRKALKTRAALYHYHDPELIGMGFVLRWVFGRRVVFDIHESVYRQLLSKPYFPRWAGILAGILYRIAEGILTVGQGLIVANANSVKDYPGCTLVQNFPRVDEDKLPKAGRFKPQDVPSLVYVGQMSVNRGAHVYLDLAHGLKQHGRDFRMTLIGEHNAAFGRDLRSRIEALGVEDCVEVTGRMDWMAAMNIVSEATVGLCLLMPVPNYTSCLSTKIIEYMMLGTPVLASDFDCWRSFVEGEQSGAMVDPEDSRRVIEVCEKMLDDVDSLNEMSKRGQQAVLEKYRWQHEFEQLLALYERMLNR